MSRTIPSPTPPPPHICEWTTPQLPLPCMGHIATSNHLLYHCCLTWQLGLGFWHSTPPPTPCVCKCTIQQPPLPHMGHTATPNHLPPSLFDMHYQMDAPSDTATTFTHPINPSITLTICFQQCTQNQALPAQFLDFGPSPLPLHTTLPPSPPHLPHLTNPLHCPCNPFPLADPKLSH